MNAHLINLSQFLSSYSNQNMKLNPDAASTLSSVTMMFFKQVLISIKTELDDKKDLFQPNSTSDPDQPIQIETQTTYPVCRAVPNYLVINTNVIISALNKMRFPQLSKKAEHFVLRILKRKNEKSYSNLAKLPLVSHEDFLFLARNLVENGHKINPDDLSKKKNERKRSGRKKKATTPKRRKKGRFFF